METRFDVIGKIEELHHKKLKRTIQDVYICISEIFVALYGRRKFKYFDAEAIMVDLISKFGLSPVQGATRPYSTRLINNSLTTIQSVR